MYRDVADYSVLAGAALYLARAALNPSRLVQSVAKTGSGFHWFVDKTGYCRRLVLLRIVAILTYNLKIE